MNKLCGLYEIVNKETGIRYLGSSSNIMSRFQHHKSTLNKGKHRNAHLQNAWNKYGIDVFEFKIIQITTEADKISSEQKLLDQAFGNNEDLYNISIVADGGLTGRKHGPEARKKMSDRAKTRTMTQETKEKISMAGKNRKHSEETKAKMSTVASGKPKSDEHKRNMSKANKGKHLSSETRAKISTANKRRKGLGYGKRASTETRLKMSMASRGKPKTPEHVAKVAASRRRNTIIRKFLNSEDSLIVCFI